MQVDDAPQINSTVASTAPVPSDESTHRKLTPPHGSRGTANEVYIPPTTFQPRPDPLPTSSAGLPRPVTTSTTPVTSVIPGAAPAGEDDDDEPMPTIDLGSDSDSE
ncbi:hypothetical protein ONZ51_g13359 [Trametes cubensis]|uniref:Uncharacterized protein n=1 Tax=Trametes cubensis TaxID=1111947 RepID=A0AAD7TEA9_9APHY|nr:hypothetical protein ONZ51_g13359 [Trametes cubensis]